MGFFEFSEFEEQNQTGSVIRLNIMNIDMFLCKSNRVFHRTTINFPISKSIGGAKEKHNYNTDVRSIYFWEINIFASKGFLIRTAPH